MDEFAAHARTVRDPVSRHFLLEADPENDIEPRPRVIYCAADGLITLQDEAGVSLSYTLVAGEQISFRAMRITAIEGGTFYGWH